VHCISLDETPEAHNDIYALAHGKKARSNWKLKSPGYVGGKNVGRLDTTSFNGMI